MGYYKRPGMNLKYLFKLAWGIIKLVSKRKRKNEGIGEDQP